MIPAPKKESTYINGVVKGCIAASRPRPLTLSARFFIVFITVATPLKSSITAMSKNKRASEGERKCAGKDGDDAAEGLSITALVPFFIYLFL